METMKIDSKSDKICVNNKSVNIRDFVKTNKKSVSFGVIVIGVLAVVSTVCSVNVTGSTVSSHQE